MKILVVGGGGREHALVWKLKQSPRVRRVYCAPGNGGIRALAECPAIDAADLHGLLEFAQRQEIDLTVVGPEAPLSLGIVDLFERHGLRIFGASRAAAEIEGSKAFAKEIMRRHGIPTAVARIFTAPEEARRYLREVGPPIVVKADGLAAGKGVIICRTVGEAEEAVKMIMTDRIFGDAGDQLVVEEFLEGEEASFLAFTDGEAVLPMPSTQDHKAVFDHDQGPNTGGMGAYSPAPVVTPALHDEIMSTVMLPTVRAMAAEGRRYCGVLYAGIMVTAKGPRVLEYNARLGDPEAQPILCRLESDLVPLIEACIDGTLAAQQPTWRPESAVCVVLASGGYPGRYQTGFAIEGLARAEAETGVVVFHAGTAEKDGRILTAGGRVLGVTALGRTLGDAIDRSYRAVEKIAFPGAHYRHDIGHKALRGERKP